VSSLSVSMIVFAALFAGALSGIFIHSKLPEDHRADDTKAVVQLVMGLVATMAALLLSLLIASAHTFYDTQQTEVDQLGANIVLLDDMLARYGAETQPIRGLFRHDVGTIVQTMSAVEGVGSSTLAPGQRSARSSGMLEQVLALTPATAAQRYEQTTALTLMSEIAEARMLIHEQTSGRLPVALFVVMLIWLTLLFLGFGLFARMNAMVIVATFFGAVSVAAAMFLILDMSRPYSGLTRVSIAPIQNALAQIDH
jgi:hypothetical protein